MKLAPFKRPHFRRPPIFEQAIALVFEPIREYSIVDPGLFWALVQDEFVSSETGPRLPASVELFDELQVQMKFSVHPAVQLPRTILRSKADGELVQFQDDKFVFNWVRTSEDAQYPRFERTSARLWELYAKWDEFCRSRFGSPPQLKQCELSNVNYIPVSDFGSDFSEMDRAFVVDPFDWNVDGLIAETYVRQRVHRMVDSDGAPIGRLHSSISPVFGAKSEQGFHFELTARSSPEIQDAAQAKEFFERAHIMINAAFLASVTTRMREVWGEMPDGE